MILVNSSDGYDTYWRAGKSPIRSSVIGLYRILPGLHYKIYEFCSSAIIHLCSMATFYGTVLCQYPGWQVETWHLTVRTLGGPRAQKATFLLGSHPCNQIGLQAIFHTSIHYFHAIQNEPNIAWIISWESTNHGFQSNGESSHWLTPRYLQLTIM